MEVEVESKLLPDSSFEISLCNTVFMPKSDKFLWASRRATFHTAGMLVYFCFLRRIYKLKRKFEAPVRRFKTFFTNSKAIHPKLSKKDAYTHTLIEFYLPIFEVKKLKKKYESDNFSKLVH